MVATLLERGLPVQRTHDVSCSGLEVPVQERRAQRTHPEYKKPELMAAPNQVWSWDITRLLGPKKWSYYFWTSTAATSWAGWWRTGTSPSGPGNSNSSASTLTVLLAPFLKYRPTV